MHLAGMSLSHTAWMLMLNGQWVRLEGILKYDQRLAVNSVHIFLLTLPTSSVRLIQSGRIPKRTHILRELNGATASSCCACHSDVWRRSRGLAASKEHIKESKTQITLNSTSIPVSPDFVKLYLSVGAVLRLLFSLQQSWLTEASSVGFLQSITSIIPPAFSWSGGFSQRFQQHQAELWGNVS